MPLFFDPGGGVAADGSDFRRSGLELNFATRPTACAALQRSAPCPQGCLDRLRARRGSGNAFSRPLLSLDKGRLSGSWRHTEAGPCVGAVTRHRRAQAQPCACRLPRCRRQDLSRFAVGFQDTQTSRSDSNRSNFPLVTRGGGALARPASMAALRAASSAPLSLSTREEIFRINANFYRPPCRQPPRPFTLIVAPPREP
jgi:hypothetical protein